ncbi:MAG TPA: DUF2202 domain-containing protein [Saprospiraceae bacterium]|nr:DUF2202 domain-containing protein [Saprospiraceae bacterium]
MRTTFYIFALLITSVSVIACNKEDSQLQNNINTPTEEVKSSLLLMREEEKLAHDVYVTLYEKWGMPIFDNISGSEQRHTDAVLDLLEVRGLSDPAAGLGRGEFSNPDFVTLYKQLVEKGSQSLMDALLVGATIEDLDLYDLDQWMLKIKDEDILSVYKNLAKGSRNHLRAFYGQITSREGDYKAQYISQQKMDEIVNSPKETGRI